MLVLAKVRMLIADVKNYEMLKENSTYKKAHAAEFEDISKRQSRIRDVSLLELTYIY